jgi:hypothetical protein
MLMEYLIFHASSQASAVKHAPRLPVIDYFVIILDNNWDLGPYVLQRGINLLAYG